MLVKSRSRKIDVALALVTRAWNDLCRTNGLEARALPTVVTALKPHRDARKSGVYRLAGVGEGGASVIAKRCVPETARLERDVYERVLPAIGMPALRCYGCLGEADGEFSWLFLQDAGDGKLLDSDQDLAAAWLARPHADAATLVDVVPLPQRGAEHYREHLEFAMMILDELRTHRGAAGDQDAVALRALKQGMRTLETSWSAIATTCASSPRSLVHGDFVAKNIRRIATPTSDGIVALDWETAGWGPIAADLPQWIPRPPRKPHKPQRWSGTVGLDVYAAHARGAWDGRRRQDLERLAAVGTILRCVTGIRWGLEQVRAGGTVKSMERLRWFAEELPHAIAAVGC